MREVKVTKKLSRIVNELNELSVHENGYPLTDNGHRIRVTAECRQHGDDVVECGASYFYRSQGYVPGTIDELRFWLEEMEYTVEALEPITETRYADRPWPQDSWATQLVRVRLS